MRLQCRKSTDFSLLVYVADIEAESTIDITNRGLLSEESDPRLNLEKWLEEKTFKNPDKIVELAEPIIADAMIII